MSSCMAGKQATLCSIIITRSLRNFLDDPVVLPTMVRRGWAEPQKSEQCYLRSRQLGREVLANFTESRVGEPHLECSRHRCSSNSLGHLYYLVRMLEAFSFLVPKRTPRSNSEEATGVSAAYTPPLLRARPTSSLISQSSWPCNIYSLR